ncbi:MAG: glycerol kinase [Desulfuromonas sp.]|nr:MAG: glycerol kinase [Desulfuromonas sp.]
MSGYILAIDQGTTGTTALLVDARQRLYGKTTIDFPQHFPVPGQVEHDPEEIWSSVRQAVNRTLQESSIAATEIAAIGITNQRETTLLWHRDSGRPAGRAIVWQDRRSADICRELQEKGLEPLYREKTGLIFDPYFSGTKLTWMLRHDDNTRSLAEAGRLAFGTIDSFLIWRLSGGQAHVSDVTNASRTLMMDLATLQWDTELAEHLEVPMALLPQIVPSSGTCTETRGLDFLPDGIPIAGIAGDQQAALFGQACFEPGEAKCTYGTGAFILTNLGEQIVHSDNGLLTTVAWQIGDQVNYALEGSSFIAGAAVQWLRDGLGLIKSSQEIEALASSVPDNGGVVFVPALTGLGAPHWKNAARGVIWGLTRGSTAAHLARATLEGIALQVYELMQAMSEDRGGPIVQLKVDGGAARNNLLMQLQADLGQARVIRPENVETTALGSALLAGLAVGLWSDLDEIRSGWREDRSFSPYMASAEREKLLKLWHTAVAKA